MHTLVTTGARAVARAGTLVVDAWELAAGHLRGPSTRRRAGAVAATAARSSLRRSSPRPQPHLAAITDNPVVRETRIATVLFVDSDLLDAPGDRARRAGSEKCRASVRTNGA